MKQLNHTGSGFTLIELLVALAIIGVLLTFLVAGIVRVREAGNRTESTSHLRQIILAAHHFADNHRGNLPPLGDADTQFITIKPDYFVALPHKPRRSFFVQILPYVEQAHLRQKGPRAPVRLFVSPADPTAGQLVAIGKAVSSYAVNGAVFRGDPRLPASFADGTSNTIALAEHYAKCGDYTFYYWYREHGPGHRPAFADIGDEVPLTEGDPPVSMPKFHPRTFQVAPPVKHCNPWIPQTPHSGGMLVALADGSVRQIAPSITQSTFWGAVTPHGRELLGPDW